MIKGKSVRKLAGLNNLYKTGSRDMVKIRKICVNLALLELLLPNFAFFNPSASFSILELQYPNRPPKSRIYVRLRLNLVYAAF